MTEFCFNMENPDLLSGKTAVLDMAGIRYILVTPPWKISEEERETGIIPLRPLAEGGQGITYLTENPNVILKFAKQSGKLISIEDKDSFLDFQNRLSYVASLPFPPGINITLPETMLQKYAGYRMPFLGGMHSLKDCYEECPLIGERPTRIPDDKRYNQIWRYVLSGGLKRRLNTAGRLAVLLAQLHLHGISYGDISPNNIFIPVDVSKKDIYLIDPDNLVENNNNHSINIGTPPYRAPEVCDGEYCTLHSDIFAYAMLVFDLICKNHPFWGRAYDDSDLYDEEKENPREFAWILDPEDTSNVKKLFIPKEELLSKELMTLFWLTFTIGKDAPLERPPMHLWPEHIFKAFDDLRECQETSCHMSLLPSNRTECPICGKAYGPELEFSFISADGSKILWRNRFALSSLILHSQTLFKRSWMPFELDSFDVPQFEIRQHEGKIYFQKTSVSSGSFWFSLSNAPERELKNGSLDVSIEELPNLQIRHEEKSIVRTMKCRLLPGGSYNG